jgi:Pyridoxal-dependent decarboxylase, pyridoxal binding domain
MTAHSLDQVWSLPADILARFEHGARIDTKPLALVDETVAVRRCALYRDGFKGTAVSYPAALLGFDAFAAWIRRHRVTVDITTAGELDRAMAAGIDPMRIVMHPGNGAAAPIRRAVNAGAGRFVVGSRKQIAILAESADGKQRVVVDATDDAAGGLVSEALAHRGLDLIGLHCRLDELDDAIGAVKLRAMIAEMAWIRREHGVLLTRISLAGLDVGERCLVPRILRGVAEAIGEVVGDACARHRFPRPALTLAPRRSALLPSP